MSEFNELIKSFAKSREYVRDFFVYGFKTRDEFDGWSSRTYDNERRRLESWLAGYVRQEHTGKAKNIYLSIDSNLLDTNPLYRVWKAKSFTDNDIMLHFYILDLLLRAPDQTAGGPAAFYRTLRSAGRREAVPACLTAGRCREYDHGYRLISE